MTTPGTLSPTEPHPAAFLAKEWFENYISEKPAHEYIVLQEIFASMALSGNRLAEVCSATLDRIINNQPVSDRYYLGLVWIIRHLEESKTQKTEELC